MPQLLYPDYSQANHRLMQINAKPGARFIPGLMEHIGDMREKENKLLKRDKDPGAPHIKNALINIPSDDLDRQRKLQDKMRLALDDMHRQIIDDVSRFIDHKVADVGWLASPVNIDYIANDIANRLVNNHHEVLAYEKNQLLSLIKLLTFFAIAVDRKEVPAPLVSKVAGWYNDAQPLFAEIKLARKAYKNFDPDTYKLKPGRINQQKIDILKEAMKINRRELLDKIPAFEKSTSYTAVYKNLLAKLFTYFNSASENAFTNIVLNVHQLGDSDLNALLVQEHKTDPATEVANLAKIVKKYKGTGLSLTEAQEAALKKSDPEGHKAYKKQLQVILDAVRLTIRAAVRKSGGKLLAADKVKAELVKNNLPTGFIPTGFEKGGQYDEDLNMYNPKGILFSVHPRGGWLRWKDGSGDDNKAIAEYQTPRQQKPAGIYSAKHTTGGLQDKKYAATDANIANIVSHQQQWTKDTKSNDAETQMLAYMAQLMYYTAIRVSSKEGKTIVKTASGGKKTITTYALTTLHAGHIKRKGPDLILDFPGKAGVSHKITVPAIDPPRIRLIKFIFQQAEGKARADYLWTIDGKRINSNDVNKYIKGHGWEGSAKTFRSVRGTILLDRMLADDEEKDKGQKFRDKDTALAYLIDKLGKVGEALGHKKTNTTTGKQENVWQTAAGSYINPQTILDFLHKHHVNPLPPWAAKLERKGGAETSDDDD
jgi:hypothetical protein